MAMRIRLRTTLAGPVLTAGAGDTVTVEPAFGTALIAAGYAVADTAAPERAVPPQPETATAPPQRRRGR